MLWKILTYWKMFWKMSLGKRACWLLIGFFLSLSLYLISESFGNVAMVVFGVTVVLPIYMSFISPSPYDDDTND